MLHPVQENPYAPPTVDQARVAPASRGWRIEEGRLLVEPEAILPMVDPYTGETSERMTALRLGLQRRVLWPRLLMWGGVLLVFAPALINVRPEVGGVGLPLFVVGLFAWVTVPPMLGYVPLFVFVGPRNQSRNQRIRWATIGLLVAIFGAMAIVPNVPGINARLDGILAVVAILLVLCLMLLRWSRRHLYWRPAPDGKREMTGVHPQAMELLRKMPAPSERS